MIGDRVEETTQTTGTGTWTLDGAATGRRTFVAAIGLTKQCYYAAENGSAWEIGIGTIGNSGADTLTRDTVIASSNAGSKVNFSAGTKIVCALSIELLGPIGARLTYAVTTGSSNAYTLATPVPSRTLVDGMEVTAKMHEAPTGASTLNHVGGVKPIRLADGTTAIASGAWGAGAMVRFKYQASGDVWCLQTYLPTLLPAASETVPGIVELATSAEVGTGTDSVRGVHAAGVAANYVAQGKHTVAVPAAAMIRRTTNGPAEHKSETTTNKVMIVGHAYDKDTQQHAQFTVPTPKGWNGGTFTVIYGWTATAGSGDAVFGCQARAYADDAALDQAFGAAVETTDTLLATGDQHISAESTAITPAGSPVGGQPLVVQVYRKTGGTLQTAILLWVKVLFTINAKNDA